MAQIQAINQAYIEKTPGVLGGKPRIAGKRIGVATLIDLHVYQDTPIDEITERLPVTPSEIHAALAYYYDHQAEIDAILAEEDALSQASDDPVRQAELDAQAHMIARRRLEQTLESGLAESSELTVRAVAELFDLDTATVRRAALDGDIEARKSGATWLITLAAAYARWGYRYGSPPSPRQSGRPARKAAAKK